MPIITLPFRFLSAACFLLATGCSNPSEKNKDKTVFRYNENVGITSLDPAFARSQANTWACNQIYNGLVQLDEHLIVQPCIAASWEITDSGKTYLFHLRTDVYFHDDAAFSGGKGRKVTGHDFVYSLQRLGDEKTASPGVWVLNTVKRDPLNGKILCEATNDTTFIIHLENSFPPFPGLLCMQYCAVVPKEAVMKYGKDFRIHPVGTGPFIFKTWEERNRLILWRNSRYFEKENGFQLPYLDAVAVSFIPDKQAAFLEFVKGNLDFISGIDASYKDDLLSRNGELKPKYRGKFIMETGPYLNTEYLGFLMHDGSSANGNPLSDKRIRQAINFGFDRDKMITYLRNKLGTPGNYGMMPAGIPGFDSLKVKGYSYNPLKAKTLLAEAGYPDGKGLPPIVLNTTPEYQDLCEYIQGQLKDLGMQIIIEPNQGAQHRELVAKQKLNFFRASWIADYPDAENYLSLFYSKNFAPGGPNTTHFRNEKYDSLFEAARKTHKDSIRFGLYQQMDNFLMEECPVVVLYYDRVLRLHQHNLEGLGINGLNLLTLKRVKKKIS